MTAPNWLSLLRIALVPVCVALLLSGLEYGDQLAAGVFFLAALTDNIDGRIARSRGSITDLGRFLDPLADKLLVTAALIALVQLGRVSAWVVIIIVAREFAVTGLRLVMADRVVLEASRLGKLKASVQMVMLLSLMLLPGQQYLNDALIVAALVLTVWSGVDYFVACRAYLSPSVAERDRAGRGAGR